jgi:hypothetical protein
VKRSTGNRRESSLRDAVATAEVLFSLGLREAQAIANGLGTEDRLELVRGLCTAVLGRFWRIRAAVAGCSFELRPPVVAPVRRFSGLVERLGTALAQLSGPRAGYLAGQIYTTLLPDSIRKALGAFYTTPPLVERLLALVTDNGFDWRHGRITDPACGGAAFLASVAPKMLAGAGGTAPLAALEDLESRLLGTEVDEFAAWMSMVLLDVTLLEVCVAAKRPLKPLVMARDALQMSGADLGQFDLVVGNPPYGKVTLTAAQRLRFKESLFGHANLYGLFTELAVRLAKPGGLIAYVTPTSFLGGEYFKNLRKLLASQAPLRSLDFVRDREGVFDGVLQETMLAVFVRRSSSSPPPVKVNLLHVAEVTEPLVVEPVAQVPLTASGGGPWLLPRAPEQAPLIRRFTTMPHRLGDYHFAVSTGQLVWNRHKEQLRAQCEPGCHPIIWAEAVSAEGKFQFQAARRMHLPYLKVRPGQDWLINQEPCLLVQRTTAKEQRRRLMAAVIPNSFVLEYPGFVVENHLNMIYCETRRPRVALVTLAALLNSATLDQVFRCVNGSVAVSAYELNSLPLPAPSQMGALQDLVLTGVSPQEIESQIAAFYSNSHEQNRPPARRNPAREHREVAA